MTAYDIVFGTQDDWHPRFGAATLDYPVQQTGTYADLNMYALITSNRPGEAEPNSTYFHIERQLRLNGLEIGKNLMSGIEQAMHA